MKKIIFFFKLIKVFLKIDYINSLPSKKIIIFDNEQELNNKLLFRPLAKHCFFLDTRIYNLKYFYINSKIFFFTLQNILMGHINFASYLAAIILVINPRVLVTTIDTSHQFYNVCKILKKKNITIRMIAIQRSSKETIRFFKKKDLKKIYIPEYFCFGKNEINLFKSMKVEINKFKVVGSMNFSNFVKKCKYFYHNKFDICLVAEYPYTIENNSKKLKEQIAHIKFLEILDKFINKYKLKLVIIGKRPLLKKKITSTIEPDFNLAYDKQSEEEFFYKKYIKTKHKYIINNKKFSSYKYAMQSKVIVGKNSTILRELLSAQKKILACNPFGLKGAEFPIKGICYLQNYNFALFEKRLKTIIKISKKKYFQFLKKSPSYLVKFDKKLLAGDIIINEIKKSLY